VLVAGLALGSGHGVAFADDATGRSEVPSEADVAAAREQAADKGRDVAAVKADLIRANLAMQDAGDAAAQAAEAWNGARWRAGEARKAATEAQTAADAARDDVTGQRELYAATVVRSYEEASQIQGIAAVVEADGIESLIDRTITVGNTSEVLDQQYDAFTAASAVAEVAATAASDASERAAAAELEAEQARDAAALAEADAGSQAEAISAAKTDLIAELAELQGISVRMAEKRQTALEEAAAAAAAAAAQAEAEAEAQAQAEAEAQAQAQAEAQALALQQAAEELAQQQQQSTPTPSPTSTPTPPPTPTPTPPPTPPAPAATSARSPCTTGVRRTSSPAPPSHRGVASP
jgi:hypothetical protein